MKKIIFFILLLGIFLAIVVSIYVIQLSITHEKIEIDENERTSLLIENWNVFPSPFERITQLGVMNVTEHEVILDTTLPSLPEKIMVYEVIKPIIDEKFAYMIANKLGFNGELVPVKQGEFRWAYSFINGTHILEVELDGSIALYLKELPKIGKLPTEEECISIAEKWLKEHGFYSQNISKVKVKPSLMYDNEVKVIGVSFWIKIGDFTLNNLGPYIGVTYNGLIHEIRLTIYDIESYTNFKPYSNFKLKNPIHALKILKAYLDSGGILPEGQPSNCITNYIVFNKLIIKKISLEYYYSEKYIQPVYVFEGEADGEDFIGIVDAIDRSS